MKLILDLLQGAGVASATGVRPFLPPLLYGLLATDDLGVDFDGTAFSFLEAPWFLVLLGVLLVVTVLVRSRFESGPGERVLIAAAVVLGALEGAGTLDDRFDVWWPGLILGAVFAALGARVASDLLARVRRRLDAEAAGALFLYAEAFALVLVGLSVLFPPLALLGIGLLVFLLLGGRRREGEKYAGLRILR
jgi:uncharacterized membrane protein